MDMPTAINKTASNDIRLYEKVWVNFLSMIRWYIQGTGNIVINGLKIIFLNIYLNILF